jgi:hypothetical protein
MFWNLTGGIFVFRGGYHAPTAAEQHELEQDDQDDLAIRHSSVPQQATSGADARPEPSPGVNR